MSDQVFYLFSAVLLGLVIGAMIMYFASGKNSNSTKTAELEEKLSNYQHSVVEHFEKTADLVDELTQSYKKVFDHLGESAKQLMSDEQLQLQIEKRKGKKITLEFLPDELNDEVIEEDMVEVVTEVSEVEAVEGDLSPDDRDKGNEIDSKNNDDEHSYS